MNKLANREAIDGVQQMHRGLQMALQELVLHKDYERAEAILRQLDIAMVDWIDETKTRR
ncbi:hypothetical protein Ga0609869_002488 [Rhodovulum iodosum]|uniref:UVR domain-containing protein n=1 Tax=Rhodovulum iodosum TaxID=68291 RepID=A0ABV3XUY1_9RHOB|nr:hypothetical protein [Rhodovulum robiginosum]